MRQEIIPSISIEDVKNNMPSVNYADDDIVFCDNLRTVPSNDTVKAKMNIFIICLQGRLMADVNGNSTSIKSGQLMVCHSNVIVGNYMFSPDFDGKALLVSNRLIKSLLGIHAHIWDYSLYSHGSYIFELDESGIQLYNHYYELIRLKMKEKKRFLHQEILSSLLRAGILDFCQAVSTGTPHATQPAITQGNVYFHKFLDLLSSTSVKRQTVNFYAGQLCITPKYLSTVCKKASGKTAIEWIQEYTLTDIEYYLRHTQFPIKQIADQMGFPTLSFFGKYVKSHLGSSPKTYREQNRKGNARTS